MNNTKERARRLLQRYRDMNPNLPISHGVMLAYREAKWVYQQQLAKKRNE